jgi:HD-GYP domain-containing protein (c-di-GMP phosphodiesterase class II)
LAEQSRREPHPPTDFGTLFETGTLGTLPIAVLLPIMDAIEQRERYPRSRVRNVATYAVALARALGLSADEIETVRLGALLCNLGMLRVPEAVLDKTTPLTEDEQARVRHHPVYGAELMANVPELREVVPIVLHHHEDWHGGGYPLGVSGDRIPLGARIVRICETYDALTCERPYRTAYPPDEALKAIAAGANRQFDPRIVHAFKQTMGREPQRDAVLDRWDSLQAGDRAWRVVAPTTTSLGRWR